MARPTWHTHLFIHILRRGRVAQPIDGVLDGIYDPGKHAHVTLANLARSGSPSVLRRR